MSATMPLPLPSLNPVQARDIARGHLALASQYRLADMDEAARKYEKQAELWLAYACALTRIKETS
jgi:hypothetical protein